MAIGAPSKLGTILIQRLDSMLGTRVGQQTMLDGSASPKMVYQPGTAENLDPLKNLPERLLSDQGQQGKDTKTGKQHQAAAGKAIRQMDLDNLLGRKTTFKAATRSAPTTLGYGARIILALLNKFPESSRTIQGKQPLLQHSNNTNSNTATATTSAKTWGQLATALNQPGANSALFAQALAQSVKNSGLFYEAHLAKLGTGQYQLKSIKQEPQAQLNYNLNTIKFGDKTIQVNLNHGLNQLLQAEEAASPKNQSAGTTSSDTNASTTTHNNNDQLQLLVRQQLEVLANQSFIWKGEAWPGAEMECEIIRHPDDEEGEQESNGGNEAENNKWSSKLKLQLAKLGNINANISLNGDQLSIHIVAPNAAEQMNQATNLLTQRLAAQGIQTQLLRINKASHTDTIAGQQHE